MSKTSETSVVILMLAYLCTHGYPVMEFETRVQILDHFGLTEEDIATVLGCTMKEVKASRPKCQVTRAVRKT